jgi:hypothetical protein
VKGSGKQFREFLKTADRKSDERRFPSGTGAVIVPFGPSHEGIIHLRFQAVQGWIPFSRIDFGPKFAKLMAWL